mmetsp:Transcript_22181/g.69200  ORF Transcript_22181/g.69200 Transcript_22181/m.69200 type:complete len:256 (-) Transcript_22181:282-1049(-)
MSQECRAGFKKETGRACTQVRRGGDCEPQGAAGSSRRATRAHARAASPRGSHHAPAPAPSPPPWRSCTGSRRWRPTLSGTDWRCSGPHPATGSARLRSSPPRRGGRPAGTRPASRGGGWRREAPRPPRRPGRRTPRRGARNRLHALARADHRSSTSLPPPRGAGPSGGRAPPPCARRRRRATSRLASQRGLGPRRRPWARAARSRTGPRARLPRCYELAAECQRPQLMARAHWRRLPRHRRRRHHQERLGRCRRR